MRLLAIILVFLTGLFSNGSELAEAERMFQSGQYQKSIDQYLFSMTLYPKKASQIRFNVAQAYIRMDSIDKAMGLLRQLRAISDTQLSSAAANNEGIIWLRKGRYPEALEAFRQALVKSPTNERARYNFELLSKRQQHSSEEDSPDEESYPPPRITNPPGGSNSYPVPPSGGELDDKGVATIDTLSVEAGQGLLKELGKRDYQFVQELPKTLRKPQKGRSKNRISW